MNILTILFKVVDSMQVSKCNIDNCHQHIFVSYLFNQSGEEDQLKYDINKLKKPVSCGKKVLNGLKVAPVDVRARKIKNIKQTKREWIFQFEIGLN